MILAKIAYRKRRETEYEILNFDLQEKGPAYTWLDQGAEELLEPLPNAFTRSAELPLDQFSLRGVPECS